MLETGSKAKEGIIIKTFEKASPANNAADILQYLRENR